MRQFTFIALASLIACGKPPAEEPDVGVEEVGQSDALYVNATAQPGGDGSASAPFATWEEAAALSTEVGWFIFASGEYTLTEAYAFDTLIIDGAGAGRTFLTGVPADVSESVSINEVNVAGLDALNVPTVEVRAAEITGAVLIEAQRAAFEGVDFTDAPSTVLSESLTITNVRATGSDLALEATGQATIDGLDVSESVGPALTLTGTGTWTVQDLEVTDIGQELTGPAGDGGVCWVVDATTVVATDVSLIRCAARGLAAREGASLEVVGGVIAGVGNTAVSSQRGASVYLEDVEVSDASILLFVTGGSLGGQRVLGQRSRNTAILVGAESDLTLLDSTFLEAPAGHVSLSGPDTTALIRGNLFDGAQYDPCIRGGTNDEAVEIRDNTLRGCGQSGISLGTGSGFVVADNEISGVELIDGIPDLADGISLIRVDAEVSGNTISEVEGVGIALLASTGSVSENSVSSSGGAGITVIESVGGELSVEGNDVVGAVGVGVAVIASEADVTGNVIAATTTSFTDGLGDGILFANGAAGDIQGNTIIDSSYHGIRFVDGVIATIEANTVSGSGVAAIHQDCGPYEPSDVEIGDNELEGGISLCDE